MKKILALGCAVLMIFLCSCGESVNMVGLLSYQEGDFSSEVKLCGEQRGYFCKKGSEYVFEFEASGVDGIKYLFSEDKLYICSGDIKIELAKEKAPQMQALLECFSLSAEDGWKIARIVLGGANVIECVSETAKIYFDAETHLPIRAEKDGYAFDIIGFTVIN